MAIVLSGSVTAAQAPPSPYITSVDPVNGAVDVPVDKVINVAFNETIVKGSAWNSISVKNGAGASKTITKTITGNVLTITTKANYTYGDTNTLYIPDKGVKDLAGYNVSAYTSTFTNEHSPIITSIDPADGAINVPVDQVITITFNNPIKAGSAWNSISVKNGAGASKTITKTIVDNILTITTKANYVYGDTNTLYIPINAVKDLIGNGLSTASTTTFTNEHSPIITSIDPTDGAINIPVNKVITITFNNPIKAGSAWNSISVKNGAGASKTITKTIADNILTITTKANYISDDTNTLYIPINAVKDLIGNGLTTASTTTFTTKLLVS
jgi:hypothetical protein